MAFQIRQAQRSKARLRLAIAAASGAGKTLSSLMLAYGITGDWAKIGMVDTENGSGELYVGREVHNVKIAPYPYGRIDDPFTIEKYLEAIDALENAGVEVIIIDSLSHCWGGSGGLLERKDRIADKDPKGNGWTAWRTITPLHNKLVETLLTSPCHIIACIRSKQEYVQEKGDNGKTTVKKLGMAPEIRSGFEYEFTTVLDMDTDHRATASKDRTGLFDGTMGEIPTPKLGAKLRAWLEAGVDAPPSRAPGHHVAPIAPEAPPSASPATPPAQPPVAFNLGAALKSIQEAANMMALKNTFSVMWTEAKIRRLDATGMVALTTAKDLRKDELVKMMAANHEFDHGAPAPGTDPAQAAAEAAQAAGVSQETV